MPQRHVRGGSRALGLAGGIASRVLPAQARDRRLGVKYLAGSAGGTAG
jgi:hypothetical protein